MQEEKDMITPAQETEKEPTLPESDSAPEVTENPPAGEENTREIPNGENQEKDASAEAGESPEETPPDEPQTQDEELSPEESKTKEKKKRRAGFRFFNAPVPPVTRRSVAIMLAITLVYSLLAFFRIGLCDIPQTSIYIDRSNQCVTIQLDEPSAVSNFCFYKWRGYKNDITVEAKLELEDEWTVVYGPSELSSHMRWKILNLDLETPVQYIRIFFEGKKITLAEIVCQGPKGEILGFTCPEELNDHLTDCDKLDRLSDEQDLFDPDSASTTYAYFDEYLYALTAYAYKNGGTGLENTHPVLGKVLMAVGISIFGMRPIGWRIFGVLSGIFMLPVMFFLGRRVLKSNRWALVATFLMAVEAMHYSQTRLATIDSFPLLFILLAYLNMLKYHQEGPEKENKALFLSGLCFGLACAFKWIGIYAGLGLALCFFTFFIYKIQRGKAENPDFHPVKYAVEKVLACTLFFVIIPVLVYVLSYLPVAFGPYEDIQGWKGIWENQLYMWEFHSTLEQTFSFSSPWYGWPLDLGGFTSYFGTSAEGLKANIITVGNPVIWWMSVPAIAFAIALFFAGRRVKAPLIPEAAEESVPTPEQEENEKISLKKKKRKRFSRRAKQIIWMLPPGLEETAEKRESPAPENKPDLSVPMQYEKPEREETADATDAPAEIEITGTIEADEKDTDMAEAAASDGPVAEIAIPEETKPQEWVRIGRWDTGLFVTVIAYLCQYVPWMIVPRECFIYHYFAPAEISILALTALLRYLSLRSNGWKRAVVVYCALAALAFVVMFPLINGFFVPTWYAAIGDIFG